MQERQKIRKTETSPFEIICEFAKKYDEDGLRKFLDDGFSLKCRYRHQTPVEFLAEHGHIDAVSFLLDSFCANMDDAVCGYAKARNHKCVRDLLANDASFDSALYGYAYAGDEEWVEDNFLKKYAEIQVRHPTFTVDSIYAEMTYFMRSMLRGYFYGGHVNKVENFIQSYLNKVTHDLPGCITNQFIQGYAYLGMSEKVNELLAQGGHKERYAFEGYIHAGNYLAVEKLSQDYPNYYGLVYCQAYMGNDEKVAQLLRHDPWGQFLAPNGYVHAGLSKNVEIYLAKNAELRQQAIEAYIEIGDIQNVEALWIMAPHLKSVASNSLLTRTDNRIKVRMLSFINTSDIRTRLAEFWNISNKLLTKASEINQLMRDYHVNYSEALVMLPMQADVKTWLLQGLQILQGDHQYTLPLEMYVAITSQLLNLPVKKVMNIMRASHEKLLADVCITSVAKYSSKLFSSHEMTKAVLEANVQHQKRLSVFNRG